MSVVHLKPILEERWKIFDDWHLVSLGRGFYTLNFPQSVIRNRLGRPQFGISRLREWTPGFDPFKLNLSTAPVWVRIYKLPYEFWHPDVITGIGKAIGNPLKIDSKTASGVFGQFARLLVEVDFQINLQETVMIDRGEKSFFVELFYENIPAFCASCKQIGHEVTKCRKNTSHKVGDRSRDGKDTGNKAGVTSVAGGVREKKAPPKGESTKGWVARTFGKGNKTETTKQCVSPELEVSANRFAVLEQVNTEKNASISEEEMIVADSVAIEGNGRGAVDDGRSAPVGVISIQERTITDEIGDEEEMLVVNSLAVEGKGWAVDEGRSTLVGVISETTVIPKKLVEQDVSDSDKLSKVDSEVCLENFDTPFVPKRRGMPRKRGSGDRSAQRRSSRLQLLPFKDKACELSPLSVARHNMSSVARGKLDEIIDSETGLSPGDTHAASSDLPLAKTSSL